MLHQRLIDFSNDYTEVKRGYYTKRNQTDLESIRMQVYWSKLSEWAVYYWIRRQTDIISPPSMDIEGTGNARYWDADIIANGVNFAVKNCPPFSINKYGSYAAWTFQAGHGRDPILDKDDPKYRIVFTVTRDPYTVEVYGVSDTHRIKPYYIFEDGVDFERLRGEKLFVKTKYADGAMDKVGAIIKPFAEFDKNPVLV